MFLRTFSGEKSLRIALNLEAQRSLSPGMRSVVGECSFSLSFLSREMVQK